MTITYKGNNIGLGYNAATGTWGLENTPTDYIDTDAFASTDPDFVYVPPTTDDSETEEDFNPCPAGYIYDSELKQCVIDPNAQSNFMQTMQESSGSTRPGVQIAGTNRTTTDDNFIATDEEYKAMSASELIENLKQRGYVSKNEKGNLVVNLDRMLGTKLFDAALSRVGQGGETRARKKKIFNLLVDKNILSDESVVALNKDLYNVYPGNRPLSNEEYFNNLFTKDKK